LTAAKIVIPGEKAEEFATFRDGLMEDWAPANTLQRELVDRLAGLLWRLRRCPVAEAELLRALINDSRYDLSRLADEELDHLNALYRKADTTPEGREMSNLLNIEDMTFLEKIDALKRTEAARNDKDAKKLRSVEMLSTFSRYETGLMNDVIKTLTLLRALQAVLRLTRRPIPLMGSLTSLVHFNRCRKPLTREGSPYYAFCHTFTRAVIRLIRSP
jgi:hypothetical protein